MEITFTLTKRGFHYSRKIRKQNLRLRQMRRTLLYMFIIMVFAWDLLRVLDRNKYNIKEE